jgi:hypothetical protein
MRELWAGDAGRLSPLCELRGPAYTDNPRPNLIGNGVFGNDA